MLNKKSPHLTLAVAVVAAIIVIAGGAAIASNTGFKMNKGLSFQGAGAIGDNWTSLPYFNPYSNVAGLCNQTGLASTGGALVPKALLSTVDPATGNAINAQCGSAAAGTTFLSPSYRGWRIRQPGPAPNLNAIIVVGSHNPSQAVKLIDAGTGAIGDNWVSVPYHTTAVFFADLCASAGLSSTGGALVPKATISRVDAATGSANTQSCGSPGAATAALVLGESVRIREPNAPPAGYDFIPAHF